MLGVPPPPPPPNNFDALPASSSSSSLSSSLLSSSSSPSSSFRFCLGEREFQMPACYREKKTRQVRSATPMNTCVCFSFVLFRFC
jgi:hypothetical protein